MAVVWGFDQFDQESKLRQQELDLRAAERLGRLGGADRQVAAFVTRWLAFYGQQMESMLTGDPSTMICRFRAWPPPRVSGDEAADT